MRLLVVAVLALGCRSREATPKLAVDPVGEAQAQAFAERLVQLVRPCNVEQVAPLVDAVAMAGKFAERSTLPTASRAARQLAKSAIGARVLCAWLNGIDEYKLLRVQMKGSEARPIMRRLIRDPGSGAVVVGYDELQLGATRSDREVRIVDALSYVQGQWITELLAGNLDATESLDYLGELPQMADTVRDARERQRAGKHDEALKIIDALPATVRNYRGVQMMRVRASARLSNAQYKQALDELATVFPDDPSIAMTEADGAFARGDWDAALRWIDVIDKAIGGDTVQETHRALAYLKKGELDKAAEHADAAIAKEPTLGRAWEVKLDVAIAQKKWADAIAVMTELEARHEMEFDEGKLQAQPAVAELVASPEYKAWRAQRK